MKISIIIPNYNGEDLLRKNLSHVIDAVKYYERKSKEKVEIIIVDDRSTDNSLEQLKEKELKIFKNDKNLGFSSTVNRGVEQSSGDIVVLLNTDVRPEKDFLLLLLKHFEDEKIFAVGCMDKSIENGKIVLRGRGVGKWSRGFIAHGRGEVNKTDTLWVSGGSGAFRKSIWQKLNGFSTLYNPFYWEDIDLSYRALKSGFKVLFEKESIVIHEHESGVIKQKYSNSQVKTIAYRNQFIFVWKNITDLDFQLQHLFWLPFNFLKAFLRFDWPFFYGFIQAFILLPKIIQSSFTMQKFFVKKDKEVLKEFSQ